MAANILTGSALIEQIFSIPGIGQQFVTSIPTKDYPVIMGTTIVYAVMLMVAILLTDIITSFVDAGNTESQEKIEKPTLSFTQDVWRRLKKINWRPYHFGF